MYAIYAHIPILIHSLQHIHTYIQPMLTHLFTYTHSSIHIHIYIHMLPMHTRVQIHSLILEYKYIYAIDALIPFQIYSLLHICYLCSHTRSHTLTIPCIYIYMLPMHTRILIHSLLHIYIQLYIHKYMLTYQFRYTPTYIHIHTHMLYMLTHGGARGVMVIVVGNGHGDTSSNPGWDWLHFT